MIEFAVVVIAVAFVVLVGYVVPTVIQIRKTVSQSEQLLSQMNDALPGILKEVRQTNKNIQAISMQAREGVERASVLMKAIGDVGQTVTQVHGVVRQRGLAVASNLVRVLLGMRAAATTIKDRVQKEGGQMNGKQ